jgi:hypothetical protein
MMALSLGTIGIHLTSYKQKVHSLPMSIATQEMAMSMIFHLE